MGTEIEMYCSWNEARALLVNTPRPFGIVVICADAFTGNKFIYGFLERGLSMITATAGFCSVGSLRKLAKLTEIICVSLPPRDACDCKKRNSIINMLHKAGVEDVYGVYLCKPEPSSRPDTKYALEVFEANPPTAAGLKKLLVVQ